MLISGRGTNMRALIERSREAGAPYRVDLVVSDQPGAPGLDLASSLSVPHRTVHPGSRVTFERELRQIVDDLGAPLIVLAGFMRILSAEFVAAYPGRILNIHPSLLPKYPGLHTHRRVLDAGDAEHGATVHFVTAELDGGPPIVQAKVPVLRNDDESTLAARVQVQEHRIYPLAVGWYCSGRLGFREGLAWLDGAPLAAPVQFGAGAVQSDGGSGA